MAVTYTRNESLPLPSSVPPSSTPTDVQSRRSPSSFDGNEPTRISSRIRKEAVYDFNRPVVLHESVEEKSVAADNVLFEFGFVMCDADSLWYHPRALFRCKAPQSKDDIYCKWRRDSILRCAITTEVKMKNANNEHVTDLDPLGSLYHPQCINDQCRWDSGKPERTIIRLERGELVTRETSNKEVNAIQMRARGKWFGWCQDVNYPMPINVRTFSKEPTAEPVKKRKIICITPAAGSSNTGRNEQNLGSEPPILPITPESQVDSPIKPNKKRRTQPRAKSFNTALQAASRDVIDDDVQVHLSSNDDSDDSGEGLVDGIMLKDQYFLPKHRYHRLVAERRDARREVRKARRGEREWKNKVDEIGRVTQEWRDQADEAGSWREEANLARQAKEEWKDKAEKALQAEIESTDKAAKAQRSAGEWRDQAEKAVEGIRIWKAKAEEARTAAKKWEDKAHQETASSKTLQEQVQLGKERLEAANKTNEASKTENGTLSEQSKAAQQETEGIRATLRKIAGV